MSEIVIGPLIFEYDQDNREMYVSTQEDHIGTVNDMWPERWEAFAKAASLIAARSFEY